MFVLRSVTEMFPEETNNSLESGDPFIGISTGLSMTGSTNCKVQKSHLFTEDGGLSQS